LCIIPLGVASRDLIAGQFLEFFEHEAQLGKRSIGGRTAHFMVDVVPQFLHLRQRFADARRGQHIHRFRLSGCTIVDRPELHPLVRFEKNYARRQSRRMDEYFFATFDAEEAEAFVWVVEFYGAEVDHGTILGGGGKRDFFVSGGSR
jgi:hypothetical protein